MLTRLEYELRETQSLASFASKAAKSRGRVYQENEADFRTCFQRDRDRILHSQAFRRLEYKTQVFLNHEGDHYRTRLTHSLEVAQLSRSICRSLQLNEDLAEAIALAHDLGHTPFGHSGEEVLHELMQAHGGFEHNQQSYRVITKLERRYPEFDGLNLSYEVREGVAKHSGEYDKPNIANFLDKGYTSLEAQAVDVADQIAYICHDVDDGISSGYISTQQLASIALWDRHFRAVCLQFPELREKIKISYTIRNIMTELVTNVLHHSEQELQTRNILTIDDVRERGAQAIYWSPELFAETRELLRFLYRELYRHPKVEEMAALAGRVLRELFAFYSEYPHVLPKSLFEKIRQTAQPARLLADYIAGMTDRYAIQEHAKHVGPNLLTHFAGV